MWVFADAAFGVAAAGVFALAGAFKLGPKETAGYHVLAVAELGLAAAIVHPTTRTFALAVGVVVSGAFAVYAAFASDRQCRCFGARLAVVSRSARIARGAGLGTCVSVDVEEQVARARRVLDRSTSLKATTDLDGLLERELLPGWQDHWVLLERERLRQIRLHALEVLAARLSETGRHCEAVEAALAVLRSDVLRESGHRTLINTYLAEGNRADAVRHYLTYRQLLERRLNLEPPLELDGLIRTVGGRSLGSRLRDSVAATGSA